MKISLKKLQKLDIVDVVYIIFLWLFSLLSSIEIIKYLLWAYTFTRACIVFATVTLLYVAFKNDIFKKWRTSPPSKRTTTRSVEGVSPRKITAKKSVFLKSYTEYFYLAFWLYAVVFVSTLFWEIPSSILFYATVGIILYYISLRIQGMQLDMSLPQTYFSQITFLKLLVLSTSLYILIIFTLFWAQEFSQKVFLFYLFALGIYIWGFTYLFSRIFQNIYHALTSRKSKLWMVSHTYFLLSGAIFFISFLLIAGKFGMFENIFIKKVTPEIYTPITREEPTIPEYQEVVEIQPLLEFYDIQAPLTLGDSGEEVVKLQSALALIGNYGQDITGQYDEYTRTTLRDVLIENCDWPESTQGIVGPQAKACLDSIEVERTIRIDTSGFEGEIISNEVL